MKSIHCLLTCRFSCVFPNYITFTSYRATLKKLEIQLNRGHKTWIAPGEVQEQRRGTRVDILWNIQGRDDHSFLPSHLGHDICRARIIFISTPASSVHSPLYSHYLWIDGGGCRARMSSVFSTPQSAWHQSRNPGRDWKATLHSNSWWNTCEESWEGDTTLYGKEVHCEEIEWIWMKMGRKWFKKILQKKECEGNKFEEGSFWPLQDFMDICKVVTF